MEDRTVRERTVDALRLACEAQREGRVLEIFDDAELESEICRSSGAGSVEFRLALEFTLAWADTAAHQWLYYPGFSEEDWPRFAKELMADLEAARPVSDAKLIQHFMPRPPGPGILE